MADDETPRRLNPKDTFSHVSITILLSDILYPTDIFVFSFASLRTPSHVFANLRMPSPFFGRGSPIGRISPTLFDTLLPELRQFLTSSCFVLTSPRLGQSSLPTLGHYLHTLILFGPPRVPIPRAGPSDWLPRNVDVIRTARRTRD